MEHLFRRALLGEPGGIQEGSEDGHLFPLGPHWENWKRAHMLGAYVQKNVLGQVSLHTGDPKGNLGRGVRPPGTMKIS